MTVTAPPVAPSATGSLTVPQGAALSIGAVLGTGVISLPALAAELAGPASLLAWLALVLLSVPLAATFAALGARYPDGGGVSTYARRAFGRRAAAVVGWCFYFAVPVGAPAAAMFAGHYVADVLGGGPRTALLTATVITLVVAVANFLGLKVSGRLQLGLASVLLVLLVVATVAALPYADLANLQPFAPHGWAAVGSAAALLVWAFAGWEAVSSLAADYQRPERDLPQATAITVVVVGVLYLAIAGTSILVLGSAAGASAAPLSDLLALGIGGPGAGDHRGRRGAADHRGDERLLRRRRQAGRGARPRRRAAGLVRPRQRGWGDPAAQPSRRQRARAAVARCVRGPRAGHRGVGPPHHRRVLTGVRRRYRLRRSGCSLGAPGRTGPRSGLWSPWPACWS